MGVSIAVARDLSRLCKKDFLLLIDFGIGEGGQLVLFEVLFMCIKELLGLSTVRLYVDTWNRDAENTL